MRNIYNLSIVLIVGTLIAACSTGVKKKSFSETISKAQAFKQTNEMKKKALNHQADLFAKDTFDEGAEHLAEAMEDKDDDKNEVIEELELSSAYFDKALKESQKRQQLHPLLSGTRDKLISTNVKVYKNLNQRLRDIDSDLIDETDNFEKALDGKRLASFQDKYLQLEVDTVKAIELGWAQSVLKKASEQNSAELAPRTDSKLRKNILVTKNLIERSPRDEAVYESNVRKTNESALLLEDVMNIITTNKGTTPETVALNLVFKNRALSNKRKMILSYQGKVDAYKESLRDMNYEIISQGMELEIKEDKVEFQNLMNYIRTSFSDKEADAYQQGDNLIIRLKDLDFEVGKAKIPNKSEDLLTRISRLIASTDTDKIIVEGHTDSTGSKEMNKWLSKKRAVNVAEYLKSNGVKAPVVTVGHASKVPLAKNDTKENRALNRRVDIVIDASAPSTIYTH